MIDQENIACQYVLDCIDIFKDTSLVRDIQNFLTLEIFPITLDDYRKLCSRLVSHHLMMFPMMFIHLMGGGIKETATRPRLGDQTGTCEISDTQTQLIQRVTLLYKIYQEYEMSSLPDHD